jgi:hypothetical protein
MRFPQQYVRALCIVAALASVAALAVGQTNTSGHANTNGQTVVIPNNARALEGIPTVRLDETSKGVKKQKLDQRQAIDHALKIRIVDGRYYWASRNDRPLTVNAEGEFIYLMSAEPGQYIRLRKVDDKISYVEHINMDRDLQCITYSGYLRVVVGK